MELSRFKNKLLESFIGNMAMFVLNLVLPMFLSRLYGVEIYGDYVYSITVVTIAMFAANFGMDVGLLYFIPKTGKKYVSACFTVNSITSAITILVLYFLMPSKVHPYLGLVWLLSAEQLFFSIYRAKHDIKQFFAIKSVVGIGGIIVSVLIMQWLFGKGAEQIIWATYIAVMISTVIYIYQCKHMFSSFNMSREFIVYSVTIIFGGAMSLLINYIDIVMIESMLTSKDVAYYKVGTELAQIPSIFLRIVNTVFPPLISKLYHDGHVDEVRRLYEKITRYLFAISTIVILGILLFWQPILSLYGPDYVEAKMVLIYRGIGQLVNASVGSVWYIVIMTGHPKIRFVGTFASAIINVILNLVLIPIMGINGAAFASMISTIFINILGFFVVKRILHSKVYFVI